MTPLEGIIRRMIEAEGPLPIDRYMALCLGHPRSGYYMTRDPFGAAGDFTTAPEISQMFGELIGIWCASQWLALGSPDFSLVELGPGRGTLMADALRAARRVPGFAEAARVVLVETSPVLKSLQRQALGDAPLTLDRLEDVPPGPLILIANEFFDALPIRQLQMRNGHWFERCIGRGQDGRLAVGLSPTFFDGAGEEDRITEISPQRDAIAHEIGRRLGAAPGAALIIDYGDAKAGGDTLQAVSRHEFIDILAAPGESDLTAHVDFRALGAALRRSGAIVHGPMTQRDFLLRMGLEQRAAILAARDKHHAESACERLAGDARMGNLFKVIAATSPGLPPPPFPFGAP